MNDDFGQSQVLTKFALTLTDICSVVNTQFSEYIIHSHINAQTTTVYTLSISPELNSALQSYWIGMTLTDSIKTRDPLGQADKKGHSWISHAMTT